MKTGLFFMLAMACFITNGYAVQRQEVVTTYYPAPYGEYDQLKSNRVAVGNATMPSDDGIMATQVARLQPVDLSDGLTEVAAMTKQDGMLVCDSNAGNVIKRWDSTAASGSGDWISLGNSPVIFYATGNNDAILWDDTLGPLGAPHPIDDWVIVDGINKGTGFDTTNQWFKPNKAGIYQISAQIQFKNVRGESNHHVALMKNGALYMIGTSMTFVSEYTSYPGLSGFDEFSSVTAYVYLDGINDYVQAAYYVRALSSRFGDVAFAANWTNFMGHYIGRKT